MSLFLAEFLISSSWQRGLKAESSDRLQRERQREYGVEPRHRYTGKALEGREMCVVSQVYDLLAVGLGSFALTQGFFALVKSSNPSSLLLVNASRYGQTQA